MIEINKFKYKTSYIINNNKDKEGGNYKVIIINKSNNKEDKDIKEEDNKEEDNKKEDNNY